MNPARQDMRGEIKTTVYNSRNPRMNFYLTRSWILGLVLLLASCCANAQTANWREPAQQLAGKISAVVGPGAVSLEFANHSSLSRSQEEDIHRVLLQELSVLGLRSVSADAAAATVHVSLSENLRDYVWVANILQGKNEPAVVMVSFPRDSPSSATHPASAVTLHKTLLWSQPDRILDAALAGGNPQNLLVLDANGVSIYQMQGGHWQVIQALPIAHERPWPRDLRGRLVLRKDHLFDAYLPGVFCKSVTGASLAMSCRASDDPWPLGSGESNQYAFFAPTRNFFTGALTPGVGKQTSAPAFFSAAPLPRDRYTLWLFAATDGSLHLLDGFTDQSAQTDWGSDIATVHSSCGSGWQVLTTAKNSTGNDTIRIFEMPDREPSLIGQPSEFHGNITALWTQSDGNSAVAVLHNSTNGAYEAYQITLACD
jgi:hypothetical protein